MKVFMYLILFVSFGLVIYNTTQIDFQNPFGKDSIVALITVMAGLCAILIIAILRASKRIETNLKKKR